MRFRVLGRLEVESADGQCVPIHGERKQHLFALLLVAPGSVLSPERLVDQLWEDHAPPTARNSLHHHIGSLRGSLGDRLKTVPGGYLLDVESGEVDSMQFETLATRGQRLVTTDPVEAVTILRDALGLWSGAAFDGVAQATGVRGEANRLEELRLAAIENLWDAAISVGDTTGAVPELRLLCDRHPFRERLWGLLMIALYQEGRQAEALRTYQSVRRLLGDELGVEPTPWLQDLEERILLHDPVLRHTAGEMVPVHRAPRPFTTYVSRPGELESVVKMLGDARLVTVTGPPGVGKTRLAMEVANKLEGRFRDGIWWVDLGALSQAEKVVDHVAAELAPGLARRLDSSDALGASLRTSRALIVLDNCEQVSQGAALAAQCILSAGSQTSLLATSRMALGVPGEAVWPVRPLEVPGGDPESGEDVLDSEAVRLFMDRASASRPDFRLTPGNEPGVMLICRIVAGLPLAIELAASQVRVRSIPDLVEDLSTDASTVGIQPTGPLVRHESLQEAIQRSYRLLSDEQSRVLLALSVFERNFTTEGAQTILGDPRHAVTEALASLVDSSLLTFDDGTTETPYYRLMQPLRDFCRGEFRASRLEELHERHVIHYVAFAEEARQAFRTPAHRSWLDRLDREYPDLMAALNRSHAGGQIENSIRLGAALAALWAKRGRGREGRTWLETLLGEADAEIPTVLVAEMATGLAVIYSFQGDFDAADKHFRLAVDRWRTSAEAPGLVDALSEYGRLAAYRNDHTFAAKLLGEALQVSDATGYRRGRRWPLAFVAQSKLFQGDMSHEVKSAFLEAADLHRSAGDDAGQGHVNSFLTALAIAEGNLIEARSSAEACAEHYRRAAERTEYPYVAFILGLVNHVEGDQEEAQVLGREALYRAYTQGSGIHIGLALSLLAASSALSGEMSTGARLLGAARRLQPMDLPFMGPLFVDRASAILQKELGHEFDRLLDDGEQMSAEEAMACAQAA